jgi:hypothetical protein
MSGIRTLNLVLNLVLWLLFCIFCVQYATIVLSFCIDFGSSYFFISHIYCLNAWFLKYIFVKYLTVLEFTFTYLRLERNISYDL